jgi:hypothetical protein
VIVRIGEQVVGDLQGFKYATSGIQLGQTLPILIKRQAYQAVILKVGAKGLENKMLDALIRTVEAVDPKWRDHLRRGVGPGGDDDEMDI